MVAENAEMSSWKEAPAPGVGDYQLCVGYGHPRRWLTACDITERPAVDRDAVARDALVRAP